MVSIRLKINIKSEDVKIDVNLMKFWFYLNTRKMKLIEQFQDELFKRLDLNDSLFTCRIYVQDYELPLFESTKIFRDSDVVV